MTERKEEKEKKISEMTPVEYLSFSRKIMENTMKASQERVNDLKKEILILQEDINHIISKRLKKGAMHAHNTLMKEKSGHLKRIKDARVDIDQIGKLLQIVKEKTKKKN